MDGVVFRNEESELTDKDWRFSNAKHLKGAKLIRMPYQKKRDSWDHEHCVGCWQKFGDIAGVLHEGYKTVAGEHWICPDCLHDFGEKLNFTVISTD